ncbi:hypothetical protein LPTSP3_g25380 [Leptospira kobayashii]|uniref:TIGR04388 family protein n=2 Tax=Leptospira kobayashii TaxID=1917830 RepID=A0ABM7USZ7_9LEPT|nr:hypothetical protein LPTSP3_g25380 [Leptospira kobayashii]
MDHADGSKISKFHREYSPITKMQAGLCLFSFVFSLFFTGTIISQEVIPQLQLEEYNANLMNQVYGQSYFLGNTATWTDQVNYYKGVLRAYWEAAADNAIYDYVSNITTNDSFNSVDAYKDYVQRELDSQKIAAMNEWENEANLHMLENRNEFVARLNSNRVDQSYLSRLGMQATFSGPQDPNFQASQLQQQIVSAANSWNANFNQTYQSGLNDFAGSLETIQNKYDSFIQSMNDSEATFSDNLSAIDSYKSIVKDAIRGIVGQFQGMLDQPCNQSSSCLYRDANNGQLNAAGQTMNGLVVRLNAVLANASLDTSNVLTTISTEINNFLADQTNSAHLTQVDYSKQITTTQNSIHSTSKYGLGDLSSYVQAVNAGWYSFGNVSGSQQSIWRRDSSGAFSGIVDSQIKEMILAIVNGDTNGIKGMVEAYVGGGRTVSILATNVYTDWAGGINSDGIANLNESNTQMNWNRDHGATWTWGANRYYPPFFFWTDWFQMGQIGYDVAYQMYDPNADAQSAYWSGNFTSLSGQLNQYKNVIAPAIGNWEAQVASYNSFYDQWKVSSDSLKLQAKEDYERSLSDLESKKSAWISKMEEERNAGLNKWEELYSKVSELKNTQDANIISGAIQNTFKSTVTDLHIATGAKSISDNYTSQLDTLSKTEFTFTDIPATKSDSMLAGFGGMGADPFVKVSNRIGFDTALQSGDLITDRMYASVTGSLDANSGYGITNSTGGFASGLVGSIQQAAFNAVGISSGGTTQKFSILNAANEKKVDTSITVDGKELTDVFGKTANGVYQLSQILSMNENNSIAAKLEQSKIVNQMAYTVDWDSKWSAKWDENGNLKLNGTIGNLTASQVNAILKKQANYEYTGQKFEGFCVVGSSHYAACQEEEKRLSKLQSEDFNNTFKSEISLLASQGYEIQNGMIVKSLSREEKIRIGQTEGLTLTDEEKETAGTCYLDPSKCQDLLKKEFDIAYDNNGGVTLSKIISNGRIGGQSAGTYISGTQNEVRHINLSQINPVTAPKGKDLFDAWEDSEWADVDAQANTVMNDFFSKALDRDSKMLTQASASIREVELKNEKNFQAEKKAAEERDAFLKDMIMAYLSGGMAGVQAALKNKVEDKINTELAAAFIRATGGSDQEIQMLSDMVGLVRGRMQANNIKKRANTMSIKDPVRSIGNIATKTYAAMNEIGNVMTFGLSGATNALVTGLAISGAKTVFGSKAVDAKLDRINGAKTTYQEIRANEKALIKSYTTQAVSTASGLPASVVGQMLTDYEGSMAAKKARRAVRSNPIANISSQITGIAGGIIKTAAVAFGAKERDIQKAISQGNQLNHAGTLDSSWSEIQSEAYANQMLGMKASSLSYSSQIPTWKNKEGIIKEVGQRIVVDEIVKATGWDKDITNTVFRQEYGKRLQKKADKKAQKEAARSTVITAIVTVATLGAGGALGAGLQGAMSSIGSAVGASANVAANVGAAVVKAAVQVVDGTRNGAKGALAGLANGVLGVVTAGAFQGNMVADLLREGSDKVGLGIGVTYDKQNGWGGSLGLGNKTNNASISFSERGATSVSLSSGGPLGTQFSINHSTSGTSSIGVNYGGKGPLDGANVSANYDLNGGGVSAGVSYTDPGTRTGFSLNMGKDGLVASAQTNGVKLGSVSENGFQAGEMSWAQENISAAQSAAVSSEKNSSLGNVLRNVPLVGKLLGAGGDIISGTLSSATDVVTLGQAGSFRAGISELGRGLSDVGEILSDLGTGVAELAVVGSSSLRDGFHKVPVIGGMLGAVGDVFAGTVSATANVLTLGKVGSIREGISDIGKGFYNLGDILVRDVAAAGAGLIGTFVTTTMDVANILTLGQLDMYGSPKGEEVTEVKNILNGTDEKHDPRERYATGFPGAIGRAVLDLVIPDYGMFGGAGWGTDFLGFDKSMRINQADVASLEHDRDMNEIHWIRRNWSTNPTKQSVGPIGTAFTLLGTAGFGVIGTAQSLLYEITGKGANEFTAPMKKDE